jgi:hypothetical protein
MPLIPNSPHGHPPPIPTTTTHDENKVANRLRLELAVLSDLRFASNSVDQLAANRALAWQVALTQQQQQQQQQLDGSSSTTKKQAAAPLRLSEQVVRLLAAGSGMLDESCAAALLAEAAKAHQPLLTDAQQRALAAAAVGKDLAVLQAETCARAPVLLAALDRSGDLSDAQLEELKVVMVEASAASTPPAK